jgi:hypothetical protein
MNNKIIILVGSQTVNKKPNMLVANRESENSVMQEQQIEVLGYTTQACMKHVRNCERIQTQFGTPKGGDHEEFH